MEQIVGSYRKLVLWYLKISLALVMFARQTMRSKQQCIVNYTKSKFPLPLSNFSSKVNRIMLNILIAGIIIILIYFKKFYRFIFIPPTNNFNYPFKIKVHTS